MSRAGHVGPLKKVGSNQPSGFTLVELLVVIGIIAVLVGILLPALSKARKQGYKTLCESNQRQIVQAILIYSQNFKGALPDNTTGGNANGNNRVFSDALGNTRYALEGWHGLGKLWITHTMPTAAARAFYCPTPQEDASVQYRQEQWYPDNGVYTGIIRIGYMYRVFDDEFQAPTWMPAIEKRPNGQLLRLKVGRLRLRDGGVMSTAGAPLRVANTHTAGPIALTSDLMANRSTGAPLTDWPHDNPWGANVGFSDGHVDWIPVPKKIAL